NTIVAGNSASASADVNGSLNSLGHNLIGDGSGGEGFAASDLLNVNPLLGPLQDNGGPTQTLAPLPRHPATRAGAPGDSERGQRGTGYPRLVNGATDIGAYEVQDGNRIGPLVAVARSPEAFSPAPYTAPSQPSGPIRAPGDTSVRDVPFRP